LENNAQSAVRGQLHAAFEIAIEADDNAQQRRLTASRRTDQRRDFAVRQRDRKFVEDGLLINGMQNLSPSQKPFARPLAEVAK